VSEPSSGKRGLPLRVKMRHSSHFVDELAVRHEAPVGKMVPLSALEPDPGQPRGDVGDLDDLVQSIRDKGILEPILVRVDDASDSSSRVTRQSEPASPRYRIIAGERRYRAALEVGLYEVPVIELQVSEEEALEIALIENLQRKDLTPFEEAEGYRALGQRHAYTHEQIAASVGKSRSSITEALALLEIPPELRRMAEAMGIQAKSALLEIAKAGDAKTMRALLERAAGRGLSRDDLRRAAREKGGSSSGRRKPYVFKFRAPDRRFALNLTFRQSTVEKNDLIHALEQILKELKKAKE
jgi:ParB family transcriptional regulator, chromosome partitioning protein